MSNEILRQKLFSSKAAVLKLVVSATILFFLQFCSMIQSFHSSEGRYEEYVYSQLKEKKVFDRAKELISARVIEKDAALLAEQQKLSPSFSEEKLDSKLDHFVVAVSLEGERIFDSKWLKFRLGENSPVNVVEVDSPKIARFYPYARSFYRVYELQFDRVESADKRLKIQTLMGDLDFDFH